MNTMFGFELLWKIVALHVVAMATHCILRMRNMEDKSEEKGKNLYRICNLSRYTLTVFVKIRDISLLSSLSYKLMVMKATYGITIEI